MKRTKVSRRQFVKRGALWLTGGAAFNIFVPKLIRGQGVYYARPAAAGGSAPTFVEAIGTDFTATQSPNISYPFDNDAINDIWLLIFATETTHSSSGTPPTGWTKLHEVDGAGDSFSTFWHRVDGTEDSEIWTTIFTTNETGRCIVLAYRGCTTSGSPIDASATNVGGTGTAHDTTSITTTVANTRVVGIFTCDPANAGVSTFAWDNPIEERIDSDTAVVGNNGVAAAIVVGDIVQASAGALTLGGDSSQSETMLEAAYALKPA